jgi:TolB protein
MLRFVFLVTLFRLLARGQDLGVFDGQSDIGKVLQPGSAAYDAGTKTYTVAGSGDNMWFATDEFHFVWKKVFADDLAFTAKIAILGADGNAHRKGVLMVRQSLDSNDVYVDAARHGEGLTSLQFRERRGGPTLEIESSVSGPAVLRLEKWGNRYYMWTGPDADNLTFAGGSAWVELHAPFYIGLGVCAHDKNALEKVAFSDVEIDFKPKHAKKGKYSTIETVLLSGDARTGYVSQKHLSSPGWGKDGHTLTFDAERDSGEVVFTPLRTAAPVGPPLAAKPAGGFSYYAAKNGKNSQVWRRSSDGSQAQQITPDDFNYTAPHESPDGKYLLLLCYSKEYERLADNIPVELRLMTLADGSIKTLATFVGGPDSLGDEPWSPDGKRVVFVSYQSETGNR